MGPKARCAQMTKSARPRTAFRSARKQKLSLDRSVSRPRPFSFATSDIASQWTAPTPTISWSACTKVAVYLWIPP